MNHSGNFESPEGSAKRPSTVAWHVDRTIPLALLIFLAIQTVTVGIWIGRTETRLSVIERWQDVNSSTDRRLAVIENSLSRIEHHLKTSD